VPTAVMVATGRGAELGVLFKGGPAVERAGAVDTVVFDKTGTLTQGRPTVIDVVAAPDVSVSADQLLARVAAVEQLSEHPLAAAVVAHARSRRVPALAAEQFEALPGHGARAVVERESVLVGTSALMREAGVDPAAVEPAAQRLAATGATLIFVAIGGRAVGVIGVADALRPDARDAVARLRKLGVEAIMLTGDERGAAEAIARQAGVDRVFARVPPEGKAAEVAGLQQDGRVVAMVGDGINDAPALAQADVGIALGSGTDVAIEASEVTLVRPDIGNVATTISLSRRAMRLIRQNLFWAFIYNVIGIPIAAGALYPRFGILLSPILASAAMAMSSVSVVGNSLRLRRFTP
jgi:Cu+-exporting ATPase